MMDFMPKPVTRHEDVPTLIQERLLLWGRAIRAQRLNQKMRMADLCARMGITAATLARLEKGDPAVAAYRYLTALQILGLLDDLAPVPAHALISSIAEKNQRVRVKQAKDDDGYF